MTWLFGQSLDLSIVTSFLNSHNVVRVAKSQCGRAPLLAAYGWPGRPSTKVRSTLSTASATKNLPSVIPRKSDASRLQTGGCGVCWLSARELTFAPRGFHTTTTTNSDNRSNTSAMQSRCRLTHAGRRIANCVAIVNSVRWEEGGRGKRRASTAAPGQTFHRIALQTQFSNRRRRRHGHRNRLNLSQITQTTQLSKMTNFQPIPTTVARIGKSSTERIR